MFSQAFFLNLAASSKFCENLHLIDESKTLVTNINLFVSRKINTNV